ncbi:MAG: hypothetical protein KGN77_05220 [Xanthomonadaceae bacterium]|nr:hypothetical protein [Xanthomonadaceae bacterium]
MVARATIVAAAVLLAGCAAPRPLNPGARILLYPCTWAQLGDVIASFPPEQRREFFHNGAPIGLTVTDAQSRPVAIYYDSDPATSWILVHESLVHVAHDDADARAFDAPGFDLWQQGK